MNTHDKIKLPSLPEPDWYLVMSADGENVNAELRLTEADAINAAMDMGGITEINRLITIESAQAYAIAAIEPYAKRIAELEAERNPQQSVDAQTLQQLQDVVQYLENEAMRLEAAYGDNFKPYAAEKARAATEKLKIALYTIGKSTITSKEERK